MPIDLTNLKSNKQSATNDVTPKYFHTDLTGNGKNIGLLNNSNSTLKNALKSTKQKIQNTAYDFSKNTEISHTTEGNSLRLFENYLKSKSESTQNIDSKTIPISVLFTLNTIRYRDNFLDNATHYSESLEQEPNILKKLNYTTLAEHKDTKISMAIAVQNINRNKKKLQNTKTYKAYNLNMQYIIRIENLDKDTNDFKINIDNHLPTYDNQEVVYYIFSATNKMNTIQDVYYETLIPNILTSYNKNTNYNNPITEQDLIDRMSDINITDALQKQAEITKNDLLDDVYHLLMIDAQFTRNAINANPNNTLNEKKLFINHLKDTLSLLYPIIEKNDNTYTESDYITLYDNIKNNLKNFENTDLLSNTKTAFEFDQIIGSNVRLSLTHLLNRLKTNNNVYPLKLTKSIDLKDYSPEQRQIIETTEPYVTGVAGAGSGKSHTLIGRIKNLEENNIKMKRILVTSFSNAAAKNIIDRFGKEINSLTNANMFNKIYAVNYPHTLSNNLTFKNTLDVIKDAKALTNKTPTMKNTIESLIKVFKNEGKFYASNVSDSKTQAETLSLIVNNNFDDVIDILNVTKQTTLSLQPIIINAMIQMQKVVKYPKELTNINIIISDESQDTSAFEYVLLLRLAIQNNAQIMIIGDANQTLYEFRNANPRFLTTLERSDVFKTFKLKTNYRSDQDILTYVNPILSVLETNATAKITLHSNHYKNFDKDVFKQNVTFQNIELSKGKNKIPLSTTLLDYKTFQDWIINQYKNKKQIAILSHTHRDINEIQEAAVTVIKNNFKKEPTVFNTKSMTRKANMDLSSLIVNAKHHIKEKMIIKTNQNTKSLTNIMNEEIEHINRRRKYPLSMFIETKVYEILNSSITRKSINELKTNKMNINKFYASLADQFIITENKLNATNALLSQENMPKNLDEFDIIVSTIHSTKGLEFDSTICYLDQNKLTKRGKIQESLRLLGVALTRAKESELILNGQQPSNKGYVKILNDKNEATDEYKKLLPSEVESALLSNPLEVAYAEVTK